MAVGDGSLSLLAVSAFPDWLRAIHLLNVLFLTLLARSGLEILSSFRSSTGTTTAHTAPRC